jgi:hypothetical protein
LVEFLEPANVTEKRKPAECGDGECCQRLPQMRVEQ